MRTDDLISTLSRDAAATQKSWSSLPLALLISTAVSASVLFALLGWQFERTDWLSWLALSTKLLLGSAVMLLAFSRLQSASRPEVSLKGSFRAFSVPLGVVSVIVLGSLLIRSPSSWLPAIRGESFLMCITSISLLSLPVLAGTLWVMSKGAVSDGFRGGLLAGLLSGAVAVLVYSLHCVEDDPAFFGIWYTLGILIATLLGGLIGRQVLRW